MNNKSLETLPENRDARKSVCDGTGMDQFLPPSRKRIVKVYGLGVLLTIVLFLFQLMMIFDVVGEVLHYKTWLRETLGPKNAGKLMVLGCFFALMAVHAGQTALWGILVPNAASVQHNRRRLLFRRIGHNSGLRRHSAEISLETSRHYDRDIRCIDVWMFDGVPVPSSTGRLAALLGRT